MKIEPEELEDGESDEEEQGEPENSSSFPQEVERDQAFMNNLDYLLSRDEETSGSELAVVTSSDDDPKGFLGFMRDGVKHYVKKASILWALTVEGKRISSDRVYRFINDYNKYKNDDKLSLGDFVIMKFDGTDRIVQILGFRFLDGKTFHGDFYKIKRDEGKSSTDSDDDTSRQAAALCNFFKSNNGIVSALTRAHQLINLKFFVRRVLIQRNIATGELKVVE